MKHLKCAALDYLAQVWLEMPSRNAHPLTLFFFLVDGLSQTLKFLKIGIKIDQQLLVICYFTSENIKKILMSLSLRNSWMSWYPA